MTNDPITHSHEDIQEGFECATPDCDNPIPYLMEEIVVPTRVIFDENELLPLFVCGDCWEEEYKRADPTDVMVSALVCVIHRHS